METVPAPLEVELSGALTSAERWRDARAALAQGAVNSLRVFHASTPQLLDILSVASSHLCLSSLMRLDVGDAQGDAAAALAGLLASPRCAIADLTLGSGSDMRALAGGLRACCSTLTKLTVHGLLPADAPVLAAALPTSCAAASLRHLGLPCAL